jgi:hypothetical protein
MTPSTKKMMNKEHRDYYTSQSRKLLRQLDKFMARSRPILINRCGKEAATAIHQETLDEYERLIPQLPYIGGRKNLLTDNLVQSAWALALYRVLQRRGWALEEIGELIHCSLEANLNRIPTFLRHWMGKLPFTRWYRRRQQRSALHSQDREYPGDWVYEFVEDDGETFDLGMDFTECGIVKFFHAQGADELTPYLCNLDYVTYEAMGVGLRRTMTLAWGCEKCDFRYVKGGEVPAAWPPRFVERHCGDHGE